MATTHFLKQRFIFISHPSVGGILLLSCVLLSMLIANSPLAVGFQNLLDQTLGFSLYRFHLNYTVVSWINDGLMAMFFLMAGVEIKRELAEGQLSTVKTAALPVLCAVGGMLVPALIYFLFNYQAKTAIGWGIPMATDIAFAVAILNALKKHIPSSLKVFLTALAIVDDLGAIVVVAVFYTSSIEFIYLLYAGGIFALMLLFNRLHVKNIWFYLVPGIVMWYLVHHSGVHATIAGVLTALAIPVRNKSGVELSANLEKRLTMPVNLLILPLFALANTNISFKSGMLEGLLSPLGGGIVAGLVIGKPIGIMLMAFIAVKTKVGKLPQHINWVHLTGLGLLAGMGFTMSIFISLLSFKAAGMQAAAKFAVLVATIIAALTGYLFLAVYAKTSKRSPLSQ